MRKLKNVLLITAIILLITGPVLGADILPVDNLKPGMEGKGLTVFKGTEISEFPFEIIDVMEGQGLDNKLILLKAGGEKIEEIGGIASGMSGSPLFVDGKLIGAIAYGWQQGSGEYAMATPIEKMLNLLSEIPENREVYQPSIDIEELNTPLVVSGLRGRALDNLKDDLERYDFKVLPGSNEEQDLEAKKELKPGSAVAVQLVRGDINVSSIGTLTYTEGDKFLAFGHPFTNRGPVTYLMTRARINATIPSQSQPFKMGAPLGEPRGMVSVDRGAGIAGQFAKYPEVIPMSITVYDRERDKEKTVNVQIVKDEAFLTSLGTNIALQALDSSLDRIGKGTAWSSITITGSGLPDFEVERKNMFYSRQDIAGLALQDYYQILDIIASNPFRRVNLMNINLEIEVSREDKVALLKEAKILNEEINPGDELRLEVTIQPYRQDPFNREISIKLPEDMDKGMSNVVISGGYLSHTGYGADYNQEEMNGEQREVQIGGYKSLDQMIQDYLDIPRNNQLLLQVYPGYPAAAHPVSASPVQGEDGSNQDPQQDIPEEPDIEQQEKEAEEVPGSEEISPEIKKKISTEYVLEGTLNLNIEIGQEQDNQEKSNSEEQTEKDNKTDEPMGKSE